MRNFMGRWVVLVGMVASSANADRCLRALQGRDFSLDAFEVPVQGAHQIKAAPDQGVVLVTSRTAGAPFFAIDLRGERDWGVVPVQNSSWAHFSQDQNWAFFQDVNSTRLFALPTLSLGRASGGFASEESPRIRPDGSTDWIRIAEARGFQAFAVRGDQVVTATTRSWEGPTRFTFRGQDGIETERDIGSGGMVRHLHWISDEEVVALAQSNTTFTPFTLSKSKRESTYFPIRLRASIKETWVSSSNFLATNEDSVGNTYLYAWDLTEPDDPPREHILRDTRHVEKIAEGSRGQFVLAGGSTRRFPRSGGELSPGLAESLAESGAAFGLNLSTVPMVQRAQNVFWFDGGVPHALEFPLPVISGSAAVFHQEKLFLGTWHATAPGRILVYRLETPTACAELVLEIDTGRTDIVAGNPLRVPGWSYELHFAQNGHELIATPIFRGDPTGNPDSIQPGANQVWHFDFHTSIFDL